MTEFVFNYCICSSVKTSVGFIELNGFDYLSSSYFPPSGEQAMERLSGTDFPAGQLSFTPLNPVLTSFGGGVMPNPDSSYSHPNESSTS